LLLRLRADYTPKISSPSRAPELGLRRSHPPSTGLLQLRGGRAGSKKPFDIGLLDNDDIDDADINSDDDVLKNVKYTWDEAMEEGRPAVGERYKVGDYVVPMDDTEIYSNRTRIALERLENSAGQIDNDEAFWRTMDDKEMQREAIQAWFDETVCCGTGPHSLIGYRFGGKKHRNRAFYAHENETDYEMLHRHFYGWASNDTLAGLENLKVATECADIKEIHRLVLEEGVNVNGLVDTISEERAIHFAAWCGSRDTVRALLDLGACPNALNYYNQSAIHRAAGGGYTDICNDLYEAGAEPLLQDAMTNTAPEWAALSAKNETCQWFYAKFIDSNGSFYPRGPPPFYGLEQNIGYNHWCPYETVDHSFGLFKEHIDPDPFKNRTFLQGKEMCMHVQSLVCV
jgi:hypothetical protein